MNLASRAAFPLIAGVLVTRLAAAQFPACQNPVFLSGFESGRLFPWTTTSGCLETEPNDSVSSTDPFCLVGSGSIDPVGDFDFYRFDLDVPGSTVYVETNSGPGLCSGIDTVVEIRDNLNTILDFDDDTGAGSCSYLIWNHTENLPLGPYYIVVRDYLNDNVLVHYGFQASVDMPFWNEHEPNGSLGTATPYCNVLKARINPIGDVDFFSFTAAAGSTIVAETNDGSPGNCATINTVLEIFNPAGQSYDLDEDSGINFCSRIELVAGTSGTWTVSVRDSGNDSVIAGYGLVVTVTP